MLALILAHRHAVGQVEQDVGGLQHRVGEEADGDRFAARRLLLERDHALELAHHRDAVEEPGELGVLVHVALHEHDRALGVEARGDQRGERVAGRGRQLGGLERLRHRVQVDDAEDRLGAVALLICDVMADRAEIVADVFLAGRLDAGKDTRHRDRG